MSSPVSAVTQPGATTGSNQTNATSSLTGSVDPLANEETFLQLLVSQLQNQDPMNPTDSNQFVSQLTSYSQLEQLINIHNDTSSLVTDIGAVTTPPATTGTAANGSAPSNSGTTNPTTGN